MKNAGDDWNETIEELLAEHTDETYTTMVDLDDETAERIERLAPALDMNNADELKGRIFERIAEQKSDGDVAPILESVVADLWEQAEPSEGDEEAVASAGAGGSVIDTGSDDIGDYTTGVGN